MPRNLTDLMATAVSAAPPEKHHAGDITHLAERQQRRRTAMVAGGAALAVVAVAGGAFGLNRNHPTTPEPVAPPVLLNQHQKVDATRCRSVAASGFGSLDVRRPVGAAGPGGVRADSLWASVDQHGRLLAVRLSRSRPRRAPTYTDGRRPGLTPPMRSHRRRRSRSGHPRDLPDATPGVWGFTGDDRLLWLQAAGAGSESTLASRIWLARRSQDDLLRPRSPSRAGRYRDRGARCWIDGDRAWFDVTTREPDSVRDPGELRVAVLVAAREAPRAPRAEAPKDALEISVADEARRVGRRDRTARLRDGSDDRRAAVPCPSLWAVVATSPLRMRTSRRAVRYLQTNGSLVAVTEAAAGDEPAQSWSSDLSGHLVTTVDPGAGGLVAMNLGQRSLVFAGTKPFAWYADDLVTGRLIRLGDVGVRQHRQPRFLRQLPGDLELGRPLRPVVRRQGRACGGVHASSADRPDWR